MSDTPVLHVRLTDCLPLCRSGQERCRVLGVTAFASYVLARLRETLVDELFAPIPSRLEPTQDHSLNAPVRRGMQAGEVA